MMPAADHDARADAVDAALRRRGGHEAPNGEYVFHCLNPAHEDTRPSASWNRYKMGGIFRCFGCGAHGGFAMLEGWLSIAKPVPPPSTSRRGLRAVPSGPLGPIVAVYDYTDANGVLLYQATRHDPKDFRRRRPDGRGGWTWSLAGEQRRVLYRLPKILAAARQMMVFIVEGEKDVHTIEQLGLLGTTNLGGASQPWLPEFTSTLSGRRIVILPDNDDAGRAHAAKIAAAMVLDQAPEVRVIHLPGVPEKGDVTDWVQGGGHRAALEALVAQTLPWRVQGAR